MARDPDQLSLLSPSQAEAAARDGMQRAKDHADRVHDGWSDEALSKILAYAHQCRAPFLIEDARSFAYRSGLEPPPDGRAWGAVTRRAMLDGYLVRVGYEKARSSNNSPKGLWALP
jgi:hypothetical protein